MEEKKLSKDELKKYLCKMRKLFLREFLPFIHYQPKEEEQGYKQFLTLIESSGEPSEEPEEIAKRFHEIYEELAPKYGYETRPETKKSWDELPVNNRNLMIATVIKALKEAPMRKLKVSKERIIEFQNLLLDVSKKETGVILAMARITSWLIEAGFEVEK